MARKSPAQKLHRIQRAIDAWESLAPDSIFFGKTLEQFKTEVRRSVQLHGEIADLRQRLKTLPRIRDIADANSMLLIENVSFGIQGDPKFGADSQLYARFGYVRKSARRKRRKKK